MMMQFARLMIGLALSFAALGFSSPSNAAPGETSVGIASASLAGSGSPTATKVTKIVFVGIERACACTRRRVDAGWAALQTALGKPAKLPVVRLQIDTQGDKVAPYRRQKPMLALPAIYFVDGKNAVLELLQGEVGEAQIAAALGK